MTREQNFEEEHTLLLEKWNSNLNIYEDMNILRSLQGVKNNNLLQKNRRVIKNENDEFIIVETCVKCNTEYPITPLYFNSVIDRNGRVNNINIESGYERICNSEKRPCRKCNSIIKKEIRQILENYRKHILYPYPDLTIEWYNSIPNICDITNIPLNEKKLCDWSMSIQNNGSRGTHTPENCVKVALEINVAEHNAIDNLKECWIDFYKLFLDELHNPTDKVGLIEEVVKWWNNSPEENGVNVRKKDNEREYIKQKSVKHLQHILNIKKQNYARHDRQSKRNPKIAGCIITKHQMYEKLIDQGFKCHYTGIPFSKNRDRWNHFSLERVDNTKNHTDENTVFICRMFNTSGGGLNRKKIFQIVLTQILVPLTYEERRKIFQMLLNEIFIPLTYE